LCEAFNTQARAAIDKLLACGAHACVEITHEHYVWGDELCGSDVVHERV
jgi:hypothetical protein